MLALLAAALSSCLDTPPEAASTRPTKTPASPVPTAKPRPTSTPNAAAKANWTVLVYLDGDNDLEQSAIDDYGEMASVGSSGSLNIIVQFDRIVSSEDWDDSTNGDWDGVKRFRVERRKKPTASNQIADLGELNMGDPRTLVDFASWGIKAYPAQHYALIFWDHGAAWPGVASDDSDDGDMITLPELAGALASVRKNTGVEKLDLIGFDACLMGQIDVLQAIAPYGQVAIGSADLEPGEGWAWNAWLNDLATKPPKNAAALAPSIIKSFAAFYKKEDDPSVTLAAFDLDKVQQMTKQLDTLASAMIGAMPDSYKAIGKARAHAAEYASGDTDISAIDLGYFADSLVTSGANKQVASAARALSQTIKEARIIQGFGSDHPKSTGISVYFPWKKKNYDSSYIKGSPLTKATQWDEFLQSFYKAGRSGSARSATTKPLLSSTTVAANTPLNLSATITGADTAYVYYFVGRTDPSQPDTVQILSMDYIYPPGATANGEIPSWQEGDDVQLNWKATSWYISNGTDVVLAPFSPVDYGTNTYSVDGTYTRKSGKATPVSIEFEVTQGRGTLQHVWAFDKGNSENPRPRELTPKAGDTFTPEITAYNTQSADAPDQTIAGTPITFGSQPLIAFEQQAPAGDYVLGLMVENIAGDISDQYADISVDNPNGDAPPAIPDALPAPAAGSSAGTLTFHDQDLGFRIDYPQGWQAGSPGTDKVVFANPDNPDSASVGVDVYALEGTLASANKAIVQDLLDADADAPGFAIVQKPAAIRVAGRDALRTEYRYTDSDGVVFHVVGVALSDTAAGATYLITFDAPEASFATGVAAFEQMLGSFGLD